MNKKATDTYTDCDLDAEIEKLRAEIEWLAKWSYFEWLKSTV